MLNKLNMKDEVLQTIELSVRGKGLDGEAMSLENTDIDTLQRLVNQWKDIIGSDESVPIKLQTGSIRAICSVGTSLASDILADIENYRQGNYKDIVNEARKKALSAMMTDARRRGHEYVITSQGKEYLHIDKSDYKAKKRNILINMETELEGIVTDAGGDNAPNIHLETRRGKCIISATRDQLAYGMPGNILYKRIRLAVSCKYDMATNLTRDYVLKNVVEVTDSIDEEALADAMKHGSQAWQDVADPCEWLAELRGDMP